MSTKKHILSEQSQADTNKLNVLFIGDEEIKERSSFAKRLIASRQITGDIKFKYQGNSDKLLETLQGNIADNFDLVVFFCSGIYESKEYNETIENLEIAISICKNLDIPIVIFTFPQYNFIRDKKQEALVKELEPYRQRVNQWIKQGANADYVVDLDFKIDEMSTFFSVYGDRISSDGHALIARKLINIIKSLDDNIDDAEIDTTGINNLITGSSLRAIQKLLVNLGYEIKFSEIRANKFGLSTKKAVAAFQLKNGLLPTGDIDLKTVKRLKSPDAIPFSSTNSKRFDNIERDADAANKDKKSIKKGDGVVTIGKAGTSADALTMARNLMRDLDLNEAQAAGIVGNMVAESGVENARPQGTKPGVKGPLVVDGVTGYGIVQWTAINRQQALADFATAEGADLNEPLSMDIEYQFFIKELLGDFKTVYDQIRDTDDVKEASTIFMQQYERPAGYNTESKINERYELSKQIYDKLVGGEGTETETGEDELSVLDAAGNIIKGVGAGILGAIAAINYAHKLEYTPSSGFRTHARPNHDGIDYHASKGTPVVLAQGGKVTRINTGCGDSHDAAGKPVDPNCGGGWGNFVQIKFADGAFCTFGHFTTVGVSSGGDVKAGTVIGTVGDTGHSYGAHLHFEYTAPGSKNKSAGTAEIAGQYFGFGGGGTETPYESPNIEKTKTPSKTQTKKATKSIVIGDSLVPYVAAQCDAKPISATPGVNSLHMGSKDTTWLSAAVGKYPMDTTVKNVVIQIGTNDIYRSSAPIESLVSNLRMTFPQAKLLVVQGNYGPTATWSKALTTVTQKQVDAFYGRFRSMGVTVISPAIGGLKEPHGHYPIYKTIGASINKNLK